MPTTSCTQAEFAALVGITQQAVSDLVRRRVLAPEAPCDEWLHAYCAHLRAEGAARDEGAHVAARIGLFNEKRIEVAMRNAAVRRTYAPCWALDAILQKVGERASAIFDQVPIRLSQQSIASADVLAVVADAVARAADLWCYASIASPRVEDEADEGG